jgi:thiol-disulfide isomerase/thioredoxin
LAASTPTLASDKASHGGGRERATRFGLVGVTIIALVCFAAYAAVLASRVDEVSVGEPVPINIPEGSPLGVAGAGLTAPDFELVTMDGQRVKLADFAGRPVWINVWASWCAPCRAEMPDIQQIYGEATAAPDGPAILLVSLGEDPADVKRYLAATKYQLPVLLDPDYSITRGYRITGLPTHFFIGRDGKIREVAIGGLKPNGMRARLARIVSG